MDMSLLPPLYQGAPATLYAMSCSQGQMIEVEDALPSSTQKFIAVTYQDLPDTLTQAFIAIEDKRFFSHTGVDLWRTGRACVNYLLGKDHTFGGSTITQQLIKNLTSQSQRTPKRKINEIFCAMDLEKHLHKQEILEAYLNVINLGNGCRGVGGAAMYYFGQSVSELTLAQCATLAAITNNPSYYDPVAHPEHNMTRRNLILEEMYRQGMITQEACTTAQNTPIQVSIQKETIPTSSWYADMVTKDVIRDLQIIYGYTQDEATALVYHGDLVIETAMDKDLQNILSAYYADLSHFPTGEFSTPQSAMMIINPYTGDILAVAGAVGEKTGYRIQNFATDTRRPLGSSIKPLSIYAPALAQNIIDFASVFEDQPIKELKGMPWPKNADGLYRGKTTVRDAVAYSTNTIAVQILEKLGQDSSFDFLQNQLHMHSLIPPSAGQANDATVSSLALGQQCYGVTLRELLGGYTICYEGIYRQPVSYHRVLNASGEVILTASQEVSAVLSPENACILTHLLEGVTQDGTAASLTLGDKLGISIAGKTGTTQNNCDRWFVGMTPRLIAAVWMGYEYPQEMRGITGNPCLGIWDSVMLACENVYDRRPWTSTFPSHPDVVPLTVCPHSGQIATSQCLEHLPHGDASPLLTGWFDIKKFTPMDCPLHKQEATGGEA